MEAFRAMRRLRMFCLLWERQAGKSTFLSRAALFWMMKQANRTCVYASASLLLGREIVLKEREHVDVSIRDLMAKESAVLRDTIAGAAQEATEAGLDLQTANAGTDKVIKECSADQFQDLFEQQKLEFRVYHSRTSYSRTQVIAPNVATARGWTGIVFLDEIAFIRDFQELWTAILPIITTNPEFRLIMSTTPPQDDTHYTYELLGAPAGVEFPPNAAGNWYESESNITVHRASAWDTNLAGKKIYDEKTGAIVSVEDSYRRTSNKQGWRVNHGLEWIAGGTGACNLLTLKNAQERGIGKCEFFEIDTDADFQACLVWLFTHIHPTNRIGLGLDVATTTKQKSNPSVLSVMERDGVQFVARAILVWKTRDPDVARERVSGVIAAIERRPGGPAKALAIDATNEKYFAEDLRKFFRGRLPVILVVASEAVDKPGLDKPTNHKEYLGDQYVAELEDNHLTLPADAYVRLDHRLVMKDRGRFVCEPDAEGRHGDTFDGNKLALHALVGTHGPIQYTPMPRQGADLPGERPEPMRRRGVTM